MNNYIGSFWKPKTLECKHCKKKFLQPHKASKYCSKECGYEANRLAKKENSRIAYERKKKAMPEIKTCTVCNKELPKGKSKYCSDSCYQRFDRERKRTIKGNCAVCSKPIPEGQRKYCSAECRNVINSKVAHIERECKCCGKTFIPNTNGAKRIYCSEGCSYFGNGKIVHESRIRECLYCGDTFKTKSEHSRFCTRTCASTFHREKIKAKLKENTERAKQKIGHAKIEHIEDNDRWFWIADYFNFTSRPALKIMLRNKLNTDFTIEWRKTKVVSNLGYKSERPIKSAKLKINVLIDLTNTLREQWYKNARISDRNTYNRYYKIFKKVMENEKLEFREIKWKD